MKASQLLFVLISIIIINGILGGFILSFFITDDITEINKYIANGLLTQIIVFICSGLLFFKITNLKWREYIYHQKININSIGITLLLFAGLFFISILLSYLNGLIAGIGVFDEWISYNIKITDIQTRVIGALGGFKTVMAILIFALLPAIAEEFIFRGILYQILYNWKKNKNTAIILSAFIFSVFHFQILNFLPIFFVGLILAYTYQKYKNLAYPILIHFLYNGIQILLV